jgi:ABC-type multidrug transport system fused ATPase/permease subunit
MSSPQAGGFSTGSQLTDGLRTYSIDKKTEEKIEFLLKTRLGGRTLIAINHRLEAVLNYDRVVVLDNGMVVDVGTPAELVVRCGLFKGLKVHADT